MKSLHTHWLLNSLYAAGTPVSIARLFLLGTLMLHPGCQDAGQEPGPDPDKPNAGYVSGKVVDTSGKPIANAKIIVDNSVFFNSGMTTATDAAGKYKLQAPQGSWRVYAQITKAYNGQRYKLDLHPDNADSFAGPDGAIRNFEWKLSGNNPNNPGTFYGGSVSLFKDPDSEMYDVENIEFTFTPVGTLIDGSPGKVLVRKCGPPRQEHYSRIVDVPIGRYKVTAVHTPSGRSLQVRNQSGGEPYSPGLSVVLDFSSDEKQMRVEYLEP